MFSFRPTQSLEEGFNKTFLHCIPCLKETITGLRVRGDPKNDSQGAYDQITRSYNLIDLSENARSCPES